MHNPGEKPFSCQNCDFKFRYVWDLKRHLKLSCKGIKPLIEPLIKCEPSDGIDEAVHSDKLPVKKADPKRTQCQFCDKVFKNHRDAVRHEIVHSAEKPFACEACDSKFNYAWNLKNHKCKGILTSIEPRIKPEPTDGIDDSTTDMPGNVDTDFTGSVQSEMSEDEDESLEKSNIENTGEKLVISQVDSPPDIVKKKVDPKRKSCQYCNKAFDSTAKVLQHEMMHTGERPFSCQVCQKRFRKKWNLKYHIKNNCKMIR